MHVAFSLATPPFAEIGPLWYWRLMRLSFCLQIIDSIIEESQKGGGVEEDLLSGEEKSSAPSLPEPPAAPDLPAAPADADAGQEARSRDTPDAQGAAPDGARASQDRTSSSSPPPPDITRALGSSQSADADTPKLADILDQVPLGDNPESGSSGPSKPPRQFTVEPDIVASTKKAPPSRPPPPGGAPPPRPPPPARPSLPSSKKSQEAIRPTRLEGESVGSICLFQKTNNLYVITSDASDTCFTMVT